MALSARHRREATLNRKRDAQQAHESLWQNQKHYYEHWDEKNTKFDTWTSPRYHETQTALIAKLEKERLKAENLEKRRETLRKLLQADEQTNNQLLNNKKQWKHLESKSINVVPTDVLKELNLGIQIDKANRERHEAENKLYHQWRGDNPILRHYERMHKGRELKLSWLDQQIEKRMRKEKEEAECRKLLKERDEKLRLEDELSTQRDEEFKCKKEILKRDLDEQVKELEEKANQSEELNKKEVANSATRAKIEQIKHDRIKEHKLLIEKETALFNIKQHKYKLKKKSQLIIESLDTDAALIERIKASEIVDQIEDEAQKKELKFGLAQFLELNREQAALEKIREKHLNLLFDSEARSEYEKQLNQWNQEQLARAQLFENIIEGITGQIKDNLQYTKLKQIELLGEREKILKEIEIKDIEMKKIEEEEANKKQMEERKIWSGQTRLKELKKKRGENEETKRINKELERIEKEEARLKHEILNIQRKQGPVKSSRSRIFF